MARTLASEHGWGGDIMAELTARSEGWGLFDGDLMVGGSCVLLDSPPKWFWARIHPDYRRKGHATALWKLLTARHGRFEVEEHQSPAMQAFIRKMTS